LLAEAYGKLPMSFEENDGQTSAAVRFLSRGPGYALFLTPTEAVLTLDVILSSGGSQGAPRGARPLRSDAHRPSAVPAGPASGSEATVLRMTLRGARTNPRLSGEGPLTATSNYFLGTDPKRWLTGVPNYKSVRYHDVYPGVDLIYHGQQRRLEYDVIVAPGADPRSVRLAFPGASLRLDPRGDLIVQTPHGGVVQHRPVVYQEMGGRRSVVPGGYRIAGQQEVRFEVGPYDRTRPLIIDPTLAYSTYLGGSVAAGFGNALDMGLAIAVDGQGNAYVTGSTHSTDFPGTSGSPIQPAINGILDDAFVTKINAAGSAIVYSTYLGGSGNDDGEGIAVDGAGKAYVFGDTESSDFPGTGGSPIQPAFGGGIEDTFVTKINAAGNAIVYSTYLGGSGNEEAGGIAVDGAGNVYVAGTTDSPGFPGVSHSSLQAANAGAGDAFVTKINPSGTAIVYSTFLGGAGQEFGLAIAIDGARNAYVTGQTFSSGFPGTSGSKLQAAYGGSGDAYVTKINAAGTAIVYSTYLGGSSSEQGRGIAVDAAGNAYLTGATGSTNFPGASISSIQSVFGGQLDGFVTKINAAGSAIVYSTYLGGSAIDQGNGIAVDRNGNAYVAGSTVSPNFPGASGSSIQPAYGGGVDDGFVVKINAAGSALLYSTYLGGSDDDSAKAIAVDGAGSAYVTGLTASSNFPGTSGSAIQASYGGGYDGFVSKIGAGSTCSASSTALCLSANRFQVTAHFDDGNGHSGTAQVVPLTPDTGYLWFFNSSNVEAVVKVLNGCGLNSRYWVFAGGLTNVKVVLTVTDTVTGVPKSYTNPPHTTYQPIQDTAAFSCGAASAADASPEAIARAGQIEAEALQDLIDEEAAPRAGDEAGTGCTPSANTLCLNNGRFQVSATFDAGSAGAGAAQVVKLTSDTGYLWFFASSNVEAVIKVLNGCGLNSHYWVFAGGLTNVKVVITVTDTLHGTSQTYRNPSNTIFQPIQETSAFATCP
jgi:hypothetical protein